MHEIQKKWWSSTSTPAPTSTPRHCFTWDFNLFTAQRWPATAVSTMVSDLEVLTLIPAFSRLLSHKTHSAKRWYQQTGWFPLVSCAGDAIHENHSIGNKGLLQQPPALEKTNPTLTLWLTKAGWSVSEAPAPHITAEAPISHPEGHRRKPSPSPQSTCWLDGRAYCRNKELVHCPVARKESTLLPLRVRFNHRSLLYQQSSGHEFFHLCECFLRL